MLICVKFEDLNSKSTQETMNILYGSPSGGYCLDSKNAKNVTPKKVRDLHGLSISYWYLDVNVLNEHYGGVMNALRNIKILPGVKSVTMFAYKDDYNQDEIEKFIEAESS